MINIEKLILFKAETSKYDLINNTEDKIIATLDDMALSATINYNLDSNHTINIELDSSLAEEVINTIGFKQIIKAKTLEDEYEYFVLTGVDKILDDRIQIIGVHWVTEITSKIFCDDLKPRGLNANLMLKHIIEGSEEYKNNIQYAKDIEVNGNIDTLVNCNLWQTSVGDYLEDLQELYGNCEVRKRGFMLSLMDYVGSRTPRYTVNYGENLISSTTSEEYILIKSVLAKGYDGIRGNIVYSNKITSGITKVIEYPVRLRVEGEEDEEGYTYYNTLEECQKALEDLAKKEFEVNKIDEIVITYDIKFLDLATTLENNGEKAYLSVGDVVNTRIDKYNININTRIIELNYNILAEEIEDIVLSNADVGSLKVPTLNSVSKEVENKPSLEEVTSTARQEITDFINAGFGGYVMIYKDEIYIMDSPKKENAVKCLRLNMNGLAGSTTGWQGPYNVAITVDGQIIADRITTGILKSLNGESWINLDNGNAQLTGNIITKSGDKYVSMNSGGITFQDNHKSEQLLRVASSYLNNRDLNGVIFASAKYADYIRFSNIPLEDLTQGWTSAINEYTFFDLCSNDFTINNDSFYKGMNVKCPMFIRNIINIKSNDKSAPHQIYNNQNSLLSLAGDNGVALGYRSGTSNKIKLRVNEEVDSNGCTINSFGNWNFNNAVLKNCTIATTLDVQTLSRNVSTEAQAMLSTNKELRILLEDIQIVNGQAEVLNPYPNNKYSISSIVKKGRGDVWIDSELEDRFIIKGENDIKVNIELVIKLEDVGGEVDGSME